MNGEVWAAIAGAFLTLIAALLALPQVRAQARKFNAEADDHIAARLTREIARLDDEMTEVRSELASVKSAAHDEKLALERENKRLRTQVGRLRRRVEGLEKILKIEIEITPEMQKLLDELPSDTDEGEQ